jgi:proline iminopeptidase
MASLFPPLEPFQKHFLPVSSIHTIYFEESGTPNGQPILFLHGGPGGGTEPDHRRLFDPNKFRIILVDQRGSGQSTPFAELRENTTWDLVNDLEKIRNTLEIDRWLIYGGSWGTTLALAYGIKNPQSVLGLILRGVFLCTIEELHWLYQSGAHWIFPETWQKFEAFIPENERSDFIEAYHRRLTSDDEALRLEAAKIWSTWEASASRLYPNPDYIKKYENPHKALPFARIEAHYFKNRAFLPTNNYILENASALKDTPVKIVHGRYDMVCPVKAAWDLNRSLPKSELQIIPNAGHSLFEPPILAAVIEACNSFG